MTEKITPEHLEILLRERDSLTPLHKGNVSKYVKQIEQFFANGKFEIYQGLGSPAVWKRYDSEYIFIGVAYAPDQQIILLGFDKGTNKIFLNCNPLIHVGDVLCERQDNEGVDKYHWKAYFPSTG